MSSGPARTPGQRAGLTSAAVLAAARDLVAEQGIDALTMRALARRLGVLPNALYSHVATKAALLDTLLDDVLAEIDPPDPEVADPVDGLRTLMTSTYEVLIVHADLVPLYISSQGARGANAQRLGEVMLALLARAGVEGDRALDARRVLIVFTIGFAAFSPRPPLESGAEAEAGDDAEVATPDGAPAGSPLSADQIAANFGAGLDWLLAGITSGE